MDGRRHTSVRQLEVLVEFADSHRDLALGRLRSKEARALAKRLWMECAEMLHCEGPARSPQEWTKVWNDMKSRVRAKLTSLTRSQRGTGGGPPANVTLSPLEERVADIIGRDIGPNANVAQDPFLQADPEDDVVIEVVEEFGENVQRHNSNEAAIQLAMQGQPGCSAQSMPWQSPSRSQQSPPPSQSQPPPPPQSQPPPETSPPPSVVSTPRRLRQPRRQQRTQRNSRTRVSTQAQTSRTALDESRAMVMRIEELRARTENMVAQAALNQSQAAKAQSEAALMQAQAVASLCQAVASLVPAMEMYLKREARKRIRRVSSPSEKD